MQPTKLRGARTHNLRSIDLDIEPGTYLAIVGPSGAGKSTLAFKTLYAEGQRRYLESLAPYVRQYVRVMERPDVDLVSGLSPTVAVEQRVSYSSRRSTVATLTEVYHFLRLLFSKLGTQHCSSCDRRLTAQQPDKIAEDIHRRYAKRSALALIPKIKGRKGYHRELLDQALRSGFTRARIDGQLSCRPCGGFLVPFYEYECQKCRQIFAELRPSSERNQEIKCPECGGAETRRVLSPFAVGKSQPEAALPCGASDASACGSGTCPMK